MKLFRKLQIPSRDRPGILGDSLRNEAGQNAVLIVIWLAVAALGIVFVNVGIQTQSKVDYAKKWPSVSGEVQSVKAETEDKFLGLGPDRIKPVVEYVYQAKEKTYTGTRVHLTDGPFKDVKETEEGIQASLEISPEVWSDKSWKKGDTVTVYYKPEYPKDAVLEIRSSRSYQKYYLVGAAALIFGLFMCAKSVLTEF